MTSAIKDARRPDKQENKKKPVIITNGAHGYVYVKNIRDKVKVSLD